jgi:hypothetical protein
MMHLSWGIAGWAYSKYISLAEAGSPSMAIPAGFSVLVSFGWIGLIIFVGGAPASDALEKMGKGPRDWRFYLFLGFVMAPGMLVFAWLKHRLSSLGYH